MDSIERNIFSAMGYLDIFALGNPNIDVEFDFIARDKIFYSDFSEVRI
jgi:hypothetical protein